LFKLGKKIQALVTYSNDVIYVLFTEESSGKGNSKDLGRGDPFNAGKQRRKGSIRKAWTMILVIPLPSPIANPSTGVLLQSKRLAIYSRRIRHLSAIVFACVHCMHSSRIRVHKIVC